MVKCRTDSSALGWMSFLECHEVLSFSSGLTFLLKVGKKRQKHHAGGASQYTSIKISIYLTNSQQNEMKQGHCLAD